MEKNYKTFKQAIIEDLMDFGPIVLLVFTMVCLLSVMSYQIGKDTLKREAIRNGNAYWSHSDEGYPEFKWKDQQQVITDYLSLNKK